MSIKSPLHFVAICASLFLVGPLVANDQQKLHRLVRAMEMAPRQRHGYLAGECTNGACAYDPVAQVVAFIERGSRISCLYLFPGTGAPWNCKTNWGRICLSYGFQYADDSDSKRFERIDYLRHDPTEGSIFVLKEEGTADRWAYCFRVLADGKIRMRFFLLEEGVHDKTESRKEKLRE